MQSGNITDVFWTTKDFDFNLLVMFEAVYIYGSVTMAAESLDLSPSSVSQSLQKLRLYFGDPLFVREGKSLSATTVAVSIHQALSPTFDNFLFAFQKVSKQTSHNRLVIDCSAYLSGILIPVITTLVLDSIPQCEIVHTISDPTSNSAEEALIYRRADIIFDSNPHFSMQFVSKKIFEEEIVFICSKTHPRLTDTIDVEQSRHEKFVLLETDSEVINEFQVYADNHFGERNIGMRTRSLLCVLAATEKSDLVGAIPKRLFEKMKSSYDIKMLKPELSMKPVSIYMIYNKTSLNNSSFVQIIEGINSHLLNWQG